MRTCSPRLTLTRRSTVSTLPPLTRASISVPANPAVVVVVEVGPAVEVELLVDPLVPAAWPAPSSPPQPATSQQASSRQATTRRGDAIDASLSARHRVAARPAAMVGLGWTTNLSRAGSALGRPAGGRVGWGMPAGWESLWRGRHPGHSSRPAGPGQQ